MTRSLVLDSNAFFMDQYVNNMMFDMRYRLTPFEKRSQAA